MPQRSFARPKRRYSSIRSVLAAALFIPLVLAVAFLIVRIGQPVPSERTDLPDAGEMRVGSVVHETGRAQCELMKFDNYTGRTIENAKHCKDTIVLDARGRPVPTGTIHRLDSISKSFLGDKR